MLFALGLFLVRPDNGGPFDALTSNRVISVKVFMKVGDLDLARLWYVEKRANKKRGM